MESITLTVNALLPLFLVMAVGYISRALGHIKLEDAQRFNVVIFRYFISAKVFYEILNAGSIDLLHSEFLQFVLIMHIVLFIMVYALSYVIDKRPDYRGSILQALYRSNYTVVGIPLIAFLFQGQNIAPASLVLLIVVPCNNALCAIALESFRNKSIKPLPLVIRSLKNPLVIVTIFALFCNKANIRLPSMMVSAIDIVSKAATGLVLFFFGASFEFSWGSYKRELIICTVLRQIIIPGLVLMAGIICGFRGLELMVILCIVISPPSTTAYPVSIEMGANGDLSAQYIMFGSVTAVVSIFCWVLVAISLGLVY